METRNNQPPTFQPESYDEARSLERKLWEYLVYLFPPYTIVKILQSINRKIEGHSTAEDNPKRKERRFGKKLRKKRTGRRRG